MSLHHVRIIPAESAGGPARALGTRVETAGGVQINGVTKLELEASIQDDLWRATVHVMANFPQVEAIAEIVQSAPPSAAVDLLAELRGIRVDLRANTDAVRAHTEAVQGMAAILAADLAEDTSDDDRPVALGVYMDGSPLL